jgi:hypothetical protein
MVYVVIGPSDAGYIRKKKLEGRLFSTFGYRIRVFVRLRRFLTYSTLFSLLFIRLCLST